MPPYRRRSFAPRGRGSRRKVVWATTLVGPTTIVAGALSSGFGLDSDLLTAGSSTLGATVMRTHARLSFSCANTDTNPGVFYGFVVWDTTIAKPDPQVDLETDWYHTNLITPGTSPSSVEIGASDLWGETIDIKARRRLHQMHDHPFLLIKNTGSTTVTVSFFVRTLLALP